jgi:hypothetical protein
MKRATKRPKSWTIDKEEVIGSSNADNSTVQDTPPSSGKKPPSISTLADSIVEETPSRSSEKPLHRRIPTKEATVIPQSDSSDCEDSYNSARGDVSTNLSETFATNALNYSSADDEVPLLRPGNQKPINAKRSSRIRDLLSSDDETADEENIKQSQQASARFATYSRLNEDFEQKEKTISGNENLKPCRQLVNSEDENDEKEKNLSIMASDSPLNVYDDNPSAEDVKRSIGSYRSTSSEEHNQNVGKEFIEEDCICISDDDSTKDFASADAS